MCIEQDRRCTLCECVCSLNPKPINPKHTHTHIILFYIAALPPYRVCNVAPYGVCNASTVCMYTHTHTHTHTHTRTHAYPALYTGYDTYPIWWNLTYPIWCNVTYPIWWKRCKPDTVEALDTEALVTRYGARATYPIWCNVTYPVWWKRCIMCVCV
jgi:hypothetical protein